MGDKSKIEWLRGADGRQGASWNAIRARNKATGRVGHFCVHKTAACKNCYAERLQPRFGNNARYAAQDRDKVELFLDTRKINAPLSWKRPRAIFPCSMTDLFLEDHPDEWIDRHFAVMAAAKQHIFIVLTKRGARLQSYMKALAANPERLGAHVDPKDRKTVTKILHQIPLPNVWIGGSCHDQPSADEIVPQIIRTPAAVRFLSVEPLLASVDLTAIEAAGWHECYTLADSRGRLNALTGWCYGEALEDGKWEDWLGDDPPAHGQAPAEHPHIDWVIVGGESGPDARPMHPRWPRSLRDQCAGAGVPFFFKQWGEWATVSQMSEDAIERCFAPPPESDPDAPRRCLVEWHALRPDGSRPRFGDFRQGDVYVRRAGKRAAGRLLDDREHNDLPK